MVSSTDNRYKRAGTQIPCMAESLIRKLKKEDICNLLDTVRCLTETADRELADSVLEVSLAANEQIVQELIGDDSMYEALMEIMEPRLVLRDKMKMEEGLEKGIQGTVNALRKFGIKDDEIRAAIIENYGISEEKAAKYL